MGTTNVQPGANLQEDCKDLRNALKGLLCNEKKVVDILGRRTQQQRDAIAEAYKTLFDESLHKHLKSSMSGKLQKCLLLWMMDPSERDALLLHEALREGGLKKDRAVIAMLCTRTTGQLYLIKQAYYSVFNETLENHLDGSGFVFFEPQTKSIWAFWRSSEPKIKEPPKRALAITKLLLALARGSRPENSTVDRHIALTDAHQLNKVCSGRLGNEENLIRIFSTRSASQLTATMNFYQQHYGHDFEKALSKKDAGEFLQALKVVVQCLRQPSRFYAEELWAVLSGAVNDDDTLIQIITTRAEVDLKSLKSEFTSESKKSLEEVIGNKTVGNFREFLLTIVNPRDHVVLRTPRVSDSSGTSYYMSPRSNGSRHRSYSSQNDSYYSGSAGSSSSNSFQL
ncbi:hypothetical protein KC19_5G061800 [Ceratodon purpureus]|uniref:Annexin n=1 Tax=Ceratodon purpureus TaxID=3225 RepID=A0A8T0HZT3_CERPU|nr:hypothetical protein KC19_5G061800 [Ceratodon purpureus]